MKTHEKIPFSKVCCAFLFLLSLQVVPFTSFAQTASSPIVCFGDSYLLSCDGLVGCNVPGASYTWSNYSGSWTANTSTVLMTPESPGYFSGTFYLFIMIPPDMISYGSCSVNVLPPVMVQGTAWQAGCTLPGNGIITTTTTGGFSNYTYIWSNGATTKDLYGLPAGTYTVWVSDAIQCQGVNTFVITPPSEMTITGTVTNVSCTGSGDGSITTTVTGGVPPFTYSWSNGATTKNISGLYAGGYTVTVTDSHLCTQAKSFTVMQASPPGIGTVAITPPSCYGSGDGSIQVFASGGVSPYTYMWNNGQITPMANNLTAGFYSVAITDAAGCGAFGAWQLNQPAPLSVSSQKTNVGCNGGNSGKIDLTVAGGTMPYTYNWNVSAQQGQGTPHVSGLTSGVYTVTITDNNFCVKIQSWTITQPALLITNAQVTNCQCNGDHTGAIYLFPSGGVSPYSYQWCQGAVTSMLTGLFAGNYCVTVSDANNCKSVTTWSVLESSYISVTPNVVNTTCPGGSNGQIGLTVSGGTGGPYTYFWSNGQTTATAINLTVGNYTVTVTNAGGCTGVASAIHVGSVNQLPENAGTISGTGVVGKGQTGVLYSVAPIAGAIGYVWSIPSGASIASVPAPGSIMLNFANNASSGYISVYGTNSCGSGGGSPEFRVTVIENNLTLENIFVAGTVCYNAIQTITVAGNGTSFMVPAGGSVTLIAGQNILLKTGTTINAGGELHGYISTDGHYCESLHNPVVNTPMQTGVEVPEPAGILHKRGLTLYPNPCSETCTVSIKGPSSKEIKRVEMYDLRGKRVFSEVLPGVTTYVCRVENLMPGIYQVVVTTSAGIERLKMIRL